MTTTQPQPDARAVAETAHTPTPWRVANHQPAGLVKVEAGDIVVADTIRNEANAAHIVRCVNAHNSLLASLARLTHLGENAAKLLSSASEHIENRIMSDQVEDLGIAFEKALEKARETLASIHP